MNCLPWMFFWFSGLPSQKWVWPSTTKMSLPSGVLYMVASAAIALIGWARRARRRAGFLWRLFDVFEHLVHVAEQDHRVVVDANHAAVVGGGVDLEGLGRNLAAEILADRIHLEDQLAIAVDADQRRLVGDGHPRLLAHEFGDGASLDRVVHGDAALVRNRLLEGDVLHRLEDV